ncbi:MAG: hypothetical protein WB789_01150 [Thermoplasmata archaeon]
MHPLGFRPLRLGRGSPPYVAIALVALLVSGLAPASSFLHAVGPIDTAPTAVQPASPVAPTPPPVHPSTSVTVAGKFYGNNSTFANLPTSSDPCGAVYENYSDWSFGYTNNYTYLDCYGGAQNPSLLDLSNGNLGVAYSTYTTNESHCTADQGQVVSRVGFQVSTDNGATYGAAQYLGNQTCSYLQAIEPSFTVSTSGTVYGTFVEENQTNTSNSLGISLPTSYINRSSDALGFTTSKNSGASFTKVTTLAAAGLANIARPQIAAFGQSIYIVYDEFNNWTNITLNNSRYTPYPATHPIAVDLIYSSDGGGVWQGPYTLPGLNGTQGYNSYSPVIAVSSTGELAVAYATDRECLLSYTFTGCVIYAEAAVVATSATNGTIWSAPSILGFAGETHQMGYDNDTSPGYWYDGYAYQFQAGPELSVAWSDTSASTLYAAWAGEYPYTTRYGTQFGDSGVFSAVSTNGGATWVNGSVATPTYGLFGVQEYNFDPALVVHGGTVYLTYTNENQTYCFGPTCSPLAGYYSYWMVNSTNGTGWGTPTYLAGDPTYISETQLAWGGYNDAITYTSDGPVASFSQPQYLVQEDGFSSFDYTNGSVANEYWTNLTGQSDLTVALPWTGLTVAVNLSENGLPAGTPWSVNFTGYHLNVTATTIVVTGVPVGQVMFYQEWSNPSVGYWTEYAVLFGASGLHSFYAPGNLTFNFTLQFGLELYINPTSIDDFNFNDYIGTTYFSWQHYGPTANYYSEPFPWYIPTGTSVFLGPGTLYSAPVAPIAFTGYGNGSSTVVASSTSLIMNGPINETIWFGSLGLYPVTFVPSGLPSTSTYSFSFGGTVYSANGTQTVTLTNVSTGAHGLSNITANSSVSGWAYFGQASSGPTVVVPNQIEVQLNFSSVDLAAPAGAVSFEAIGLAEGDFWTLSFNGSQYGSSTPWINVTAHPGNYSVSSSPVPASANDTSAYSPVGFGPTLSVTPSTTYPVDFAPTYRVEVIAGAGGTVTGAGSHWLAPGSLASYAASPHADYAFLGWTGNGVGSYSGTNLSANVTVNGPLTESANFQPLPVNRFNLTLDASGLPAGTWWTVNLGGTGYSTDESTLVVTNLYPCSAGALGLYSLSVPDSYVNGTAGTRFLPGGVPTSICTTGSTSVTVAFATEYLITPIASGGGSADAVVSGTPSSSPVWAAAGTKVDLKEEADQNDQFVGWVGIGPGAYTGPTQAPTFDATGPVTETATFAAVIPPPPVTYRLSVHTASSFDPGTSWAITVAGVGYGTTGSWINISALSPGPYTINVATSLSPDRLTQYTPGTAHTSITLSSNQTVQVTFGTGYWVNESASPGGALSGAFNGFESAGRSLTLGATPSSGYVFVQWVGTGSGAYSGVNASASVVVNSPITELASFAPIPPTGTSGSSLSPGSLTVVAALAVIGLVVGLGVGYVVTRRRGGDPGGSA